MITKASPLDQKTYTYPIFFFADDAVFLANWDINNALNLIRILFCFKQVSGLSVNYDKSSLFGIGVNQEDVQMMAAMIGCKPDSFPATFLGIPIGRSITHRKLDPADRKNPKEDVDLENENFIYRREINHCE